jgi:hypothetical protein
MKRAVLWIRQQPHYRRDAFVAGLRKLGYEIVERVSDPRPGDVLVSWNMYPSNEPVADHWRKAGAKVLIAENGYIGKDTNGHQLYALARDGHNGSGSWYVGEEDRWTPLGIELQPFRVKDGPIIVRAQRGIGTKLMASPPRWERQTVAALQKAGYKAELRLHPGTDMKQARDDPDEKAIARASAVVIWSSSFGVKALAAGVPVFYAAPHWICSEAVSSTKFLELWLGTGRPCPDDDERDEVFYRLAWAQWRISELESGEPFQYLLEVLP